MTNTRGYTVSVQEVCCEFGQSTGWQAVMTIHESTGVRKVYNTVWSDKFDAMHDQDRMCEHADMWMGR